MTKSTIIKGNAIIIKDRDGNAIDDIDTDMIFHNKHLHITNIEEMGKYTFGNLPGWEKFPEIATKGDILIVGKNFGAGSSRQQAVDCFTALGINLIIGESFGAIYKRNAINSGIPLMIAPKIMNESLKTGDSLKVNLKTGEIINLTVDKSLTLAEPLSKVQIDIYLAGNLFAYGSRIFQG
ncbi:LeuD/DmdB family oxidoreductase small subunit [Candidatus Hodarchaeum mangrovi]